MNNNTNEELQTTPKKHKLSDDEAIAVETPKALISPTQNPILNFDLPSPCSTDSTPATTPSSAISPRPSSPPTILELSNIITAITSPTQNATITHEISQQPVIPIKHLEPRNEKQIFEQQTTSSAATIPNSNSQNVNRNSSEMDVPTQTGVSNLIRENTPQYEQPLYINH
jgi:hypothetical protein